VRRHSLKMSTKEKQKKEKHLNACHSTWFDDDRLGLNVYKYKE
jgi:hypothetical protein